MNMSDLPTELIFKIFGYLEDPDLHSLDQVSKKFQPFTKKIRIEDEKRGCPFFGVYNCRFEKVTEINENTSISCYINDLHRFCDEGEDAYEEIEHELDSMDLTSQGLFKLCYILKFFPPYFGMNF